MHRYLLILGFSFSNKIVQSVQAIIEIIFTFFVFIAICELIFGIIVVLNLIEMNIGMTSNFEVH